MTSEADIWKRRIVLVLQYFDEERDVPWNFVERSGDGRFEAIVTLLIDSHDGEPNEARQHSLGVFDTCDTAIKTLYADLRRSVVRLEWPAS